MGFLKSLADGINAGEFDESGRKETDYDHQISAMHFCHNIVFIEKCDEASAELRSRRLD
ncbi:MAG: hypothetical protein ABI724_10170 [Betaproteobacteria bacterium]